MADTQPLRRWQIIAPAGPHNLPGDVPPLVAQVLLGRGIDSREKLLFFLNPPQQLPYNAMRLAGMEAAVRRVYRAIDQEESIGVFGDFDVDGVTGTAIIAEGLTGLGAKVVPYLPHRTGEGHGLSASAVQLLAGQGVRLIITVDCGITAFAEVEEARRLGTDVIITDHHVPHDGTPGAVAIINPKLSGGQYPFNDLCGAGLAFKLIQGVYQFHNQPWSHSLLELAALGTIADLVPLVDENRYLVQAGLVTLERTRRPGLRALYRRAGLQPGPLTPETVAFQITPRLNSPGRMGHALDSYQLLTTPSADEAEALAERLEGLNQDRRTLTEEAYAIACHQIQQQEQLPPILLVADPGITPGVAGLVAGRLAEGFHRPAVVMAVEDEFITASGRSIPEFNLVQAFATCQDLFVRYGGHSQAAGFTLPRSRLAALVERLSSCAATALQSHDLRPVLRVDAEASIGGLTTEVTQWLAALEPFGVGNTSPIFLTRSVHVLEARYLGKLGQHLKLRIRQGNHEITAFAFNQAERWIPETPFIDVVYSLTADSRQGDATALKVLDFRPSSD